jgi:sugar transferase (PEP-CTERM/EpsH1 system associated)
VDDLLGSRNIERALVFGSAMAQYVERVPPGGMRRVLDFVDSDSDKWRQYSERNRGLMRWMYGREAQSLFELERRYAAAFDASVFVSEAESRPSPRRLGNGCTRVSRGERRRYRVFLAGARLSESVFAPTRRCWCSRAPWITNIDAVAWFAREAFPRVPPRCPQAFLYIVGARPRREVRDLARLPGVRVTGAVPDVRSCLAHARAAVAPLRIARGVQNKVLEAMAMARPVVASPQAIDGIRPCSELLEWTADAPEASALPLMKLLHEPTPAALGEALRALVSRHYSWRENLARVEAILEGGAPA